MERKNFLFYKYFLRFKSYKIKIRINKNKEVVIAGIEKIYISKV